MNDLITLDDIEKRYSNFREKMQRACSLFDSIRSFEDIETHLLRGAGLSPETYRSYMTAVRQLYEHTGGLNPFQIKPGHIESYYDSVVRKHNINTAYARIVGLKRFFKTICELVPIADNPFDIMGEDLKKKFTRHKKRKTKEALSPAEVKRLLAWLGEQSDELHQLAYVSIFMLATSGLRVSELCQLEWKDIELREGTYYAHFIAKGGDPAEQELYAPAVEACRMHNSKPGRIFLRIGDPRPVDEHAIWYVIQKIGKEAQASGIINERRRLTWSPHLFRRSYATMLYRNGMKIKAISHLTRHSSIDVLMDHYISDEEPAAPILAAALS